MGCSPWGHKELDTTEQLTHLPLTYGSATYSVFSNLYFENMQMVERSVQRAFLYTVARFFN